MGKKGQLTLFIIVAVVIVIVIIGWFVFLGDLGGGEKKLSALDVLKENVLDCFTGVYENSLGLVGARGGYYDLPTSEYVEYDFGFFAYHYYLGNISLPTKEIVQLELSKAADERIVSCLKSDEYNGFDFTFDDVKTSSVIGDEEVRFETDVSLSVVEGDGIRIIELGESSVFIESSLNDMLDIAVFMADYAKDNNEGICVSCINEMAIRSNLFVEVLDLLTDENDFMVIIYTEEPNKFPKMFEFMNKYKFEELNEGATE